ncbi:uncharacterized protein LOC130401595 [Gadus chalcogrammus]|uniref:uncharacterized protein LOC130401595 n=1 Tax=Gadus chalcogrammus TaxID=1042646 RepID=UPI0024C4A6AE|nr:uncharacterized protein LOC130401595 [Gadus chalcogrammus]
MFQLVLATFLFSFFLIPPFYVYLIYINLLHPYILILHILGKTNPNGTKIAGPHVFHSHVPSPPSDAWLLRQHKVLSLRRWAVLANSPNNNNNNGSLSQPAPGPLARPSEQLSYLAAVQGLQVEYKDFPKNNKNEFVSLINCSSVPPLLSHGIGKDVSFCHDMAARNILKLLSESDQQSSDRSGNAPTSGSGKQEMEAESLLLQQANPSPMAQAVDGSA